MLDNRYAILFIRGERPIIDDKFDILRHPNVSGTTDGKTKPFYHGAVTGAVATLVFDENIDPADLPELELTDTDYELLSEEDLENRFMKEDTSHEKK